MKVRENMSYEVLKQQIAELGEEDAARYDLRKIDKAYAVAYRAHGEQRRNSGELYIVHPLTVASILVDLGMDTDAICAGLLHDVVEDTEATLDDIERAFGKDVRTLVDGLTAVQKMRGYYVDEKPVLVTKEDEKLEAFLKALRMTTTLDARIMVIKMADRLHNIRTVDCLKPERKLRIANETLKVYVPMADSLGIYLIKSEMEEKCMRVLDEVGYEELEQELAVHREKWNHYIEDIQEKINHQLSNSGIAWIKPPKISGRVKSTYSIYNKIYRPKKGEPMKTLDDIYDICAVRVIVTTKEECYQVQGELMNIPEFQPMPSRHKDYIQQPKDNGYRSIHNTIEYQGYRFEVQIRTAKMHKEAEYGVAAHWNYKEGSESNGKIAHIIMKKVSEYMDNMQGSEDATEIISVFKDDKEKPRILVYTPQGEEKFLPEGANVLDFAYYIHDNVGHSATAAIINGKHHVGLGYVLKNADTCDVIRVTGNNVHGPYPNWLNIVTTAKARARIRRGLRRRDPETMIQSGKEILFQRLKDWNISIQERDLPIFFNEIMTAKSWKNIECFYESVGNGSYVLENHKSQIFQKYEELYKKKEKKEKAKPIEELQSVYTKFRSEDCVTLDELKGCKYHLAKCCNPLPGKDEIIGHVRVGNDMAIHRIHCENYLRVVKQNDPDALGRWKRVKWDKDSVQKELNIRLMIYTVRPQVEVMRLILDSAERVGVAVDGIQKHSKKTKNNIQILELNAQAQDTGHLKAFIAQLRDSDSILSVNRIT